MPRTAIQIYLDRTEEGEACLTMVLHEAALFEHGDEILPCAQMTHGQARELAALLIQQADRVYGQ
jgi:hypothetical protein